MHKTSDLNITTSWPSLVMINRAKILLYFQNNAFLSCCTNTCGNAVNLQYAVPCYQHALHTFGVMSPSIYIFGHCTELEVASLTMARGTMPATSSWARRISVSTSWVAARLAGYSTCQAIQRLPIGSGKLSIFRSTWSTLWTPISDLSACRKKKKDISSEWLSRWPGRQLEKECAWMSPLMCVRGFIQPGFWSNDDKRERLMNVSAVDIYDILPAEVLQNAKSLCVWLCSTLCFVEYHPTCSTFLSHFSVGDAQCKQNLWYNLSHAPKSNSKEYFTMSNPH